MPRIIRDSATAIGTTTAMAHTMLRMSTWRVCQQMTIAHTT
jgi:hypothetical protein